MSSIENINSAQNLPRENTKSNSPNIDNVLQEALLAQQNLQGENTRTPYPDSEDEIQSTILAEYDLNKDGKLDRDEVYKYFKKLGEDAHPLSTNIVTNDLKVYDSDKDNRIGSGKEENQGEVDILINDSSILKQYDLNKDGKLDLAEANKYFTDPQDKGKPLSINIVANDIKAFDFNKDGKIDLGNVAPDITAGEGSTLVNNYALLDKYDLDKDGKLDYRIEFASWRYDVSCRLLPDQKIIKAMLTDDSHFNDANKNGFIDPDER